MLMQKLGKLSEIIEIFHLILKEKKENSLCIKCLSRIKVRSDKKKFVVLSEITGGQQLL